MSKLVVFSARNATLATLHLEGGEGKLQNTAAYYMACFLSVSFGTEIRWCYEGSEGVWVISLRDALAETGWRFGL